MKHCTSVGGNVASDLRILYLNTSSGWGGMEMHPLDVAQALARRGSTVLLGMRGGSRMARSAMGRGLAPLALRFRWYLDAATLGALRRTARSFGINVIHVHSSRDAWRGLVLAGLVSRRAVLVFSRHLASPAGTRKDDPLHRLLARRVDAMVAVSEYIRGNILDTYPIDPGRVRVVPYGLGPGCCGRPEAGALLRRELGVSGESLLVGLVGQITPDKRQDLLLEAAARVVKQNPGCVFVLAGAEVHSAYAGVLQQRLGELGLAGHVRLTGFREDVPSLMQALDVLVVPSRAEAFGLVVLEAMANGKPVVGSDSGAIPEIVKPGETGLLFESGCAESLAAAVLELAGDPQRRREMGRRAEESFQEHYRMDREVTATEALYRELLERRSRSGVAR